MNNLDVPLHQFVCWAPMGWRLTNWFCGNTRRTMLQVHTSDRFGMATAFVSVGPSEIDLAMVDQASNRWSLYVPIAEALAQRAWQYDLDEAWTFEVSPLAEGAD